MRRYQHRRLGVRRRRWNTTVTTDSRYNNGVQTQGHCNLVIDSCKDLQVGSGTDVYAENVGVPTENILPSLGRHSRTIL